MATPGSPVGFYPPSPWKRAVCWLKESRERGESLGYADNYLSFCSILPIALIIIGFQEFPKIVLSSREKLKNQTLILIVCLI